MIVHVGYTAYMVWWKTCKMKLQALLDTVHYIQHILCILTDWIHNILLTKQHLEQRLKRIHDRQEAARKLAHNVELLLQQKSLIGDGGGVSHNTPKMTSSELMTTARHVAKDFRTLTCQMTNDFAVDDKNNNLSKECQSRAMTTYQKEKPTSLAKSSSDDNNRSVAFTVGFDEDKQPVYPIPKALQVPCRKDRLTAQELDEKLRKATERRNVSQVTMLQGLKCSLTVYLCLVTGRVFHLSPLTSNFYWVELGNYCVKNVWVSIRLPVKMDENRLLARIPKVGVQIALELPAQMIHL